MQRAFEYLDSTRREVYKMDRNKLFRELYRRCCNEFIEFRAILVGKKTVKVFFSLDTGLDIIDIK